MIDRLEHLEREWLTADEDHTTATCARRASIFVAIVAIGFGGMQMLPAENALGGALGLVAILALIPGANWVMASLARLEMWWATRGYAGGDDGR